jgi:hypothetical protein
MKLTIWFALVFAFGAFAADKARPQWKARMGELSRELAQIVPYLYVDSKESNESFKKEVKDLYEAARKIDAGQGHPTEFPDGDPALPFIAGMLRQDVERAYESANEGHLDYAKQVVRQSVAYCIACHTRTAGGARFPIMSAFDEPLKNAKWVEKIEIKAATRQFEPVITEVMTKLAEPSLVGVAPLEMENAVRTALAIAVRVNDDPERAEFIARAVEKSSAVTVSLKRAAGTWLKDIAKWREEKKAEYATDLDLIRAARRLAEPSGDVEMHGFAHDDIRFLRATVLMNDLLRRFPKSAYAGEAYYLIGISYDSLAELGLWSLDEMYLLACIEKVPHTPQAKQCFRRYKESVTLGYTGSSGTHLPKAVIQHLKRVEKQATP